MILPGNSFLPLILALTVFQTEKGKKKPGYGSGSSSFSIRGVLTQKSHSSLESSGNDDELITRHSRSGAGERRDSGVGSSLSRSPRLANGFTQHSSSVTLQEDAIRNRFKHHIFHLNFDNFNRTIDIRLNYCTEMNVHCSKARDKLKYYHKD